MLNISQDGVDIANRFFEVISVLKESGRIRGLQTFTRRHGLNYGNMATVKSNITTRSLKPEYIKYLVEDYGVSCEYIILGILPMFKPSSSKTAISQTQDNAEP